MSLYRYCWAPTTLYPVREWDVLPLSYSDPAVVAGCRCTMVDPDVGHCATFISEVMGDERKQFFGAAREGCVRCVKAWIVSGRVGVNSVCDMWGNSAMDYTITEYLRCPSTALDEVIATLGYHCGRSNNFMLQAVPADMVSVVRQMRESVDEAADPRPRVLIWRSPTDEIIASMGRQ